MGDGLVLAVGDRGLRFRLGFGFEFAVGLVHRMRTEREMEGDGDVQAFGMGWV